jgi:hypothetical protein
LRCTVWPAAAAGHAGAPSGSAITFSEMKAAAAARVSSELRARETHAHARCSAAARTLEPQEGALELVVDDHGVEKAGHVALGHLLGCVGKPDGNLVWRSGREHARQRCAQHVRETGRRMQRVCAQARALSSVSVPRPRRRRSSSSMDGGAMKTKAAPSAAALTASAPCTSTSRMQTFDASVTHATDAKEVP